jgi:hypothetical protein
LTNSQQKVNEIKGGIPKVSTTATEFSDAAGFLFEENW